MKFKFSNLDLKAILPVLSQRLLELRLVNVYDIDGKTYLFKFAQGEKKAMLLVESGCRLHFTDYEWPKHLFPNNFAMKLRKHIRNKRLSSIKQLFDDRIVNLTFGTNEVTYHVIVELYDRGNIILADHEFNIINVLRPRTDDELGVHFAVKNKYPIDKPLTVPCEATEATFRALIAGSMPNCTFQNILRCFPTTNPQIVVHCLAVCGFSNNIKKDVDIEELIPKLFKVLELSKSVFHDAIHTPSGYIIKKKSTRTVNSQPEVFWGYEEFHPYLFNQHTEKQFTVFENFGKAVDEYFSQVESQKIDSKAALQEKKIIKKMDKIKLDHEQRVAKLVSMQEIERRKGEYIQYNIETVDKAIGIVNKSVANQMHWDAIQEMVNDAQEMGDPVACCIDKLILDKGRMIMNLGNAAFNEGEELESLLIEIDLNISGYSNAKIYYNQKKVAAIKEAKTLAASEKAFKAAEKKTTKSLKQVQKIAHVKKSRKIFWFEKFYWFISSENYIVIGGRDGQQNELIVKRHLRAKDVYVHADLHGASSVIIKNRSDKPVPPKTLEEAGAMSICYSQAWAARVVTSAWWVNPQQVSKTAPSGEYLTTGAFMIRGKKNYLPPFQLVLGFGFMFKLDADSVDRHKNDRRVKGLDPYGEMSVTADKYNGQRHSEVSSHKHPVSVNEIGSVTAVSIEDAACGSRNRSPPGLNDGGELVTCVYCGELGALGDVMEETAQRNERFVSSTFWRTEIAKLDFDDVIQTCDSDIDDVTCDRNEETSLYVDVDAENEDGFVAGVAEDTDDLDVDVPRKTDDSDEEEREEESDSEVRDMEESCNPDAEETSDLCLDDETAAMNESEELPKDHAQEYEFPDTEVQNVRVNLKTLTDKIPKTVDWDHIKSSKVRMSAKARRALKKPGKVGLDEAVKVQAVKTAVESKKPETDQPKRGRKSKMKLARLKYKDQDVDDRLLRMELLAPRGREEKPGAAEAVAVKHKARPRVFPMGEINLEDDEPVVPEDVDVVDTLTGLPHRDDTLLFAVPFVAPYSTTLNYKYKVKITPGVSKKGKAARAALDVFLRYKSSTPLEKDLLKAVRDVSLSDNLPGKVNVFLS